MQLAPRSVSTIYVVVPPENLIRDESRWANEGPMVAFLTQLLLAIQSRLAFLAPQIVEAIVAGNQPPELTAEALAERIDLPLLWTAQEKAVGIA